AASKAAADLLCMAYHRTYRSPVIITRCCNNYGPYQFPEKLIPLIITNALEGKPVPIYGDGLNKRDWIYVTDHCRAIETVISKGKPGHIYNIGTSSETTNLEVVNHILDIMKKPRSLINFVKDRPGHDRRYALDTIKINKALNWQPVTPFAEGLKKTVDWYLSEKDWWQRIKKGEYAQYYERMYSQR
ncbi:GDP-mannose 4,6-dehydratase, partial [Candidatus Pacearchaeota archaeon]|nr:GDP-mannose 4,6-dehydratase [Candidatus Pacearchaeota archaeon]